MGKLTTHVLDTAGGKPAFGVDVRLYYLADGRELCARATTNADGRTDEPLLEGRALKSGQYELEFDVGDYFREQGQAVAEPAFLDTVIMRFAVNAGEQYHVPLLTSPWSYTTYRGS